jgi:hypothetical protein
VVAVVVVVVELLQVGLLELEALVAEALEQVLTGELELLELPIQEVVQAVEQQQEVLEPTAAQALSSLLILPNILTSPSQAV